MVGICGDGDAHGATCRSHSFRAGTIELSR